MRRRRTTGHENGSAARRKSAVSPCDTSIREKRLLEGRFLLVTTQIPLTRLTRVGKGTSFGRTQKWEGRVAVSVIDLRRSNRLARRRYANPGGTWLWIGCASGHGGGLLVRSAERRKTTEADADLRHHHTRAGGSAGLVARARLHPSGHGKYGGVLEAGLCGLGRRVGNRSG